MYAVCKEHSTLKNMKNCVPAKNEYETYIHQMLMYGKEARDRKQEIDSQHHTIPNQRTKDQKTSIVAICITGYGIMDNSIHSTWKN